MRVFQYPIFAETLFYSIAGNTLWLFVIQNSVIIELNY